MKHFYVLIDHDREGELIYKALNRQNFAFEMSRSFRPFPAWHFEHDEDYIMVYGVALKSRPVGENREEIELRVLIALDLD